MYSVLLVEDEKIELDTLKNYVDWNGCGIDRIFTARGGRSALQRIAEEEPNIIFSDIQMPGMTGIELAEIIRQEGYKCKIVFLTGYDRFEYAREAVRLQAEDFLLKPFQIDEVESVTRKLVEKISRERVADHVNRLAVGEVIEKACRGHVANAENIADFYFQKPAEQVFLSVLAARGITHAEQEKIAAYQEVIHVYADEELCLIFLPEQIPAKGFIRKLYAAVDGRELQVVYQDERVCLLNLQAACVQFHACTDDLFYAESDCRMSCDSHQQWLPYRECVEEMQEKSELLRAIVKGETEAAETAAGICLDKLKGMQQSAVCQNAFQLYLYLHRHLEKPDNIDGKAAVPNLVHVSRYEEMCENLNIYIRECCEAARSRKNARWSSFVTDYIHAHYMEDCTVEEMAEQVQVSPNYLRRKFKDETGFTVLEFLTDYRLERAAELLKNNDRKVKDVAPSVGYPNISYFTQLFSKKYGVTPNEYKKGI